MNWPQSSLTDVFKKVSQLSFLQKNGSVTRNFSTIFYVTRIQREKKVLFFTREASHERTSNKILVFGFIFIRDSWKFMRWLFSSNKRKYFTNSNAPGSFEFNDMHCGFVNESCLHTRVQFIRQSTYLTRR